MRKVVNLVVMSMLSGGVLVLAQGPDVAKVLASARQALGGEEKLAAVKTLAATGEYRRISGNTTTGDYELVMELPDKFVQKQPAVSTPMFTLSRTAGFNGDGLISVMEQPPQIEGMTMNVRSQLSMGSPDAQAAARKNAVLAAKESFAQITLGMFATSFSGYPVTFGAMSVVDAGGAQADAIDVKGDGDFAATLVIDRQTHLPLMLIWQAKEPTQPIVNTSGGDGGGRSMQFVQGGGGGAVSGAAAGSGDPAQMQADLAERVKQMEANRKTVEYRLAYSDYREVDGLKVPFHFSRSIAGQPSEEITLGNVRVNVKIDPKKFEVSK